MKDLINNWGIIMKILTKTLLSALVLGATSTAVFATDVGLTGGKGGDSCETSSICSGEIKVSLEIPKTCTLKVNTPTIAMLQTSNTNNWSGSGNFDVTSNSSYSLGIVAPTKLTSSTGSIPVAVATTLNGATYNSGSTLAYSATARNFKVQANSNNVDPNTTQAGTYTGTYTVAVNF